MRPPSALIVTVLLAVAPAALSTEPCFPRTMRPSHVSAFATAPPDDSGSGPVTSETADPAASELQLQADCLAWEASLSPKAEFVGVGSLGALVSSRVNRPQVGAPTKPVRVVDGTGGTLLRSSWSAARLFETTSGTDAFTLGATLIPVP